MEKWKFFTLPRLELPPLLVVQPVASRYIDWAIPAPLMLTVSCIIGVKCTACVIFLRFRNSERKTRYSKVSSISFRPYPSRRRNFLLSLVQGHVLQVWYRVSNRFCFIQTPFAVTWGFNAYFTAKRKIKCDGRCFVFVGSDFPVTLHS
jgi:hypothetical protein